MVLFKKFILSIIIIKYKVSEDCQAQYMCKH